MLERLMLENKKTLGINKYLTDCLGKFIKITVDRNLLCGVGTTDSSLYVLFYHNPQKAQFYSIF